MKFELHALIFDGFLKRWQNHTLSNIVHNYTKIIKIFTLYILGISLAFLLSFFFFFDIYAPLDCKFSIFSYSTCTLWSSSIKRVMLSEWDVDLFIKTIVSILFYFYGSFIIACRLELTSVGPLCYICIFFYYKCFLYRAHNELAKVVRNGQ